MQIRQLINGQLVAGAGNPIPVMNPSTGAELVAQPVQPALHPRRRLSLPRRAVRPPRRAQGQRLHRLARLLGGVGAA